MSKLSCERFLNGTLVSTALLAVVSIPALFGFHAYKVQKTSQNQMVAINQMTKQVAETFVAVKHKDTELDAVFRNPVTGSSAFFRARADLGVTIPGVVTVVSVHILLSDSEEARENGDGERRLKHIPVFTLQ